MKKYSVNKIISKALMLAVFLLPSMASAEDIEIYFQQQKPKVNLMFVLDSSYSMGRCQGGSLICGRSKTRMDILKDSMEHVIKNLQAQEDQNINVGLASLTGSHSDHLEREDGLTVGGGSWINTGAAGGYILYPVRNVNAAIENKQDKVNGKVEVATADNYIASQSYSSGYSKRGSEADFFIPYNDGNKSRNNELSAMVFKGVNIPHGATIKSAKIILERKSQTYLPGSIGDRNLNLNLYYSIQANSKPFNFIAVDQDIKNREWKPSVPFQTGQKYKVAGTTRHTPRSNPHELNMLDVVKAAVNDTAWCGGSDLTIGMHLVDPSKNDYWKIQTRTSDTDRLPTLEVEWEFDPEEASKDKEHRTCANLNREILDSKSNAVVQGKNITYGKNALLSANQTTLLRFSSFGFKDDDRINEVILRLPVIKSGISDDLDNYDDKNFTVDAKIKNPAFFDVEKNTSSLWNDADGDAVEVRATFVKDSSHAKRGYFRWLELDVTDLIRNNFCDQGVHCSSNSYDVLLQNWRGENLSTLKINYVGEDDVNEPDEMPIPYPEIKFNINTQDTSMFAENHGDKMIDVTHGLSRTLFSAEKPVHKAYVEVARYMLGGNVYFGNGKHDLDGCGLIRQRALSHPDSYAEGGLSSLRNKCGSIFNWDKKNNLDTPYMSPLSEGFDDEGLETCEKNAIILVTDGRFKTTAGDKTPTLLSEEPFNIEIGKDAKNDFSCGTDGFFKTLGDIFTPLNNFGSSLYERAPYQCSALLADFLNKRKVKKDGSEVARPITTHMIGFMLDANENRQETSPYAARTLEAMRSVTNAGGGLTKSANSPEELTQAMTAIVNSVAFDNASMASPGIAVDADTRLEHLNELFYGLFKPRATTVWPGNLKKYQLGGTVANPDAHDALGKAAIDETTGLFKPTARSFWNQREDDSYIMDGNDVEAGGAVRHLQEKQAQGQRRNLFVTKSSSPNKLVLVSDEVGLTRQELGIEEDGLSEEQINDKIQRIKAWLNSSWGDLLHSEPRMVSYGASKQKENVIYVSGNNGFLHAVHAKTGEELFAFSPKEELKKASRRLNSDEFFDPLIGQVKEADDIGSLNSLRDRKDFSYYGLDSTWTIWQSRDANGKLEHVYGYAGQRRGGNNYYALDLSQPGLNGEPAPEMLWQLSSGTTGFDRLGQTWSEPQLGKVRMGGKDVPVVVFAGGYDRHYDKGVTYGSTDKGNALYIVNAENGELIWSTSSSGVNTDKHTVHKDMQYSIPATPAVVDVNGDGYFDYIYVGDMQGQVFRVDVNNSYASTVDSTAKGLVERVNLLAKLGKTPQKDNRRFYSTPAVAIGTDGNQSVVTVVVGSGNRANPLSDTTETKEAVYALFDRWAINRSAVPSPIGVVAQGADGEIEAVNLIDALADNVGQAKVDTVGKGGWKLELDSSAGVWEKSLSQAVIADHTVFFTTFTSEENSLSDACNRVIGKGRLYAVDLTSGGIPEEGVPGAGSTDQRFVELNTVGIPPRPQILLNTLEASNNNLENACNRTLSGIVGTHAFNIQSGNLCGLQRTGWFEASEEKADELLGIKQTSDEGGTK